MTNKFRNDEDEIEQEVKPAASASKSAKVEIPKNFFTLLFTKGVISKQAATASLPFIIFIAFLGMIYIANRHLAEKNIRDIEKLSNEVKELSWDFKTLKAELMLKSTQTEVAKVVDSLVLIESKDPPTKILIKRGEF
jgi:hypothetical protein